MVEFLLRLLLIVFPFGQLTRLPLPRGETNIYLHDLIVVALLLTWLGKKILKKEKFAWPRLTKAILGFILIAGFSLVLAIPSFQSRALLIGSLYLLRWLAYAGLYFVLSDLLRDKPARWRKTAYQLLFVSGTTAALLGLGQYLFFPDIRSLTQYDWDPHYYRVVGPYLDPGYTGMIYVLVLILILSRKQNLWQKISFVLLYLALALTYSRSSYLAYLVAMGIIAWYKKSAKFFAKVLLVGVLTVFLLPRPGGEGVKLERQSTIWARINNWRQTLIIGWKQPLFGTGFNLYRYVQKDYGFLDEDNWQKTHSGAGADSSFFFVLATTGIVGLLTYLELIRKVFTLARQKKSWLILASLSALLTHSFFNNSLFYAWIMIWLWVILSLEVKEYKKQ
jgi:hypothetical protein